MSWLFDLYRTNPTAQAIAIISLVCVAGMALGSLKFRGIGLGTAGVLFAGILVGSVSHPVDHQTLEFVKEFGLMLFVFCIGLQLGPGFVASLRQFGMRLNVLAAAIVLFGALTATGLGWLLEIDSAAVPGLLAGATTNTPSLGAAQQTLSSMPGISAERAALPALAYAVTYPVAIIGIILTLLVLKRILRIDAVGHAFAFAAQQQRTAEPLQRRTLRVDNIQLEGTRLVQVLDAFKGRIVVSRIKPVGAQSVQMATSASTIRQGDLLLAVGAQRNLDEFEHAVGHPSDEDLLAAPGAVGYRRVVVTHRNALGKTLHDLQLEHTLDVVVTRITRADLEMTAVPNLALQFGDVLQVVGTQDAIAKAEELLGNSLKALNETHFVPLFAGLACGIALGTLPIAVPGIPQPLRLGLAGGPLIVALVVGRLGHVGPLVWHMPLNANLAFREFGIALFFACVGLLAGPQFFAVVLSSNGAIWLASGLCITMLPLLLIGFLALALGKMNFAVVSGLLAGSMTDPPALTFASTICESESPTVAYAAVYPLTTLLRILTAQFLAVALCG